MLNKVCSMGAGAAIVALSTRPRHDEPAHIEQAS
jgi:hypothetical protein